MTAAKLQPESVNYSQPEISRSAPKRAETGTADVVAVKQAVAALGLKLGTLRRLIDEGMPTVRRASAGGGRGNTTLLHLPTCRQWLAARQQPGQSTEALPLQLAAELPHVIGAALDVAGRRIESPSKPELLRLLPAIWWLVATAMRDHLTEHGCPELATLTRADLPPALARLLDSKLQSKR